MFDYVGVGVLVVLILLFGWLTTRSWRIKNGALRWVTTILSGLLTLIFGAATVMALVGYTRLNAQHTNPVHEVSVAMTPENIARGEKFARACAGCHSSTGDLPLSGQNFLEGAPFGTFYAPNLTPIHLQDWSDGEIIRAIREGVRKDGRSLLIMPSSAFHNLSDEDVQAVVAYLRSQPAIEPASPQNNLNVIGAILFGMNPPSSVQAPITAPVAAPQAGVTPEYGGYLVSSIGCRDCHGSNMAGGTVDPSGNGPPAGPNLTRAIGEFDEAQFITLLRSGALPNGDQVSEEMPYKDYEKFSDDDFRAIYAYLKSLPEQPDN